MVEGESLPRLGVADFVVIGLTLCVSACVGLFFRFTGGRQKTTQEFLMAGKAMGIGPVAFSHMATYISAITVLGLPAETYTYGTQTAMWMVGVPIGAVVVAYGLLPVFYEMQAVTANEYLQKRFGGTTRMIVSVLFTLKMILYMAVVLYAPSLALNAVTGLSTWTSIISLAVVCTFICSLGGLKAVLWTDVFQAFLMYITIIAVMVKIYMVIGFNEVHRIADTGGRLIWANTSVDMTDRYTLWNCLVSGLFQSLCTFGANQTQIQRMLCIGNIKKAQYALLLSLPLVLFFYALSLWDGVAIYAFFHDCDPLLDRRVNLESADQLLPLAVVRMFGSVPGLSGLCIAGVFSASLSTMSSAINSLTVVTMEDFIRPFCFCKRLSESWMAFVAKFLAVGYGGLTLLVILIVVNFRGVLEAANILCGMIAGPVFGVYFLGMFCKRANEKGTLIGLLVGFAINAWLGFGSFLAKSPIPKLPQSIEGCNLTSLQSGFLNQTEGGALLGETEATELIQADDSYIFPVYKWSYIWFSVTGFISVIIVGYISSFLLSLCIPMPTVKPAYMSPLVRKYFFKSEKPVNSIKTVLTREEMNEKIVLPQQMEQWSRKNSHDACAKC